MEPIGKVFVQFVLKILPHKFSPKFFVEWHTICTCFRKINFCPKMQNSAQNLLNTRANLSIFAQTFVSAGNVGPAV